MFILFVNKNSDGLYGSTDGGATISKINSPISFISGITMHPVNPQWLLAYQCNQLACSTTFYSKDFGKTWKQGPKNLAPKYILWGNDPNSPDTVFAIRSDDTFSYTTNYGTSWTTLFSSAIGYVMTDNYLYVGVEDRKARTAVLYSSSNRNDPSHTVRDFYWEAEFPDGNDLPEQGYTFLDDSTRSEFIAVKQPSSSNNWASVYSSDFDGDQFVLSLNYVAQDEIYQDLVYDFDAFNGLPGMFVANAYPDKNGKNRQTYLSFDNGGDWRKATAPATNKLGIPTNCSLSAGCSLHLHGQTSWYGDLFPPAYTSSNAIGLMVAIGNTGAQLTMNSNKDAKTYFTRDAGLTWSELFDQPTIYEFGDHGGILVYAPISVATTTVYFSLDEGKTSQSVQFSAIAMFVDNIFTEPSGKGLKFVLYAHTGNSVSTRYYIFGIDFSQMGFPLCGDSDYENWSPSNGDNKNALCFMGATRIYKRRKQASQCYNDKDTDRVIQTIPCPCDWEDYECDVGFTASARNDTDYFTCSPTHSVPLCATGYRLIPDTACDIFTGIDLRSKNCPGYSGTPTTGYHPTTSAGTTGTPAQTTGTTGENKKKESHAGAVVAIVLIFIILFGGAGAVGFLYYKNENFREWVLSKFTRNTSSASYGRLNTDENDEDDGSNAIA
jgi:hypothetical protein